MTPVDLVLIALVGIAAGFINVLAGGGSLLSVPVLLFFGLPGPVANGTNRVAIVAQCAAAGITYLRSGFDEWRTTLTLTLATLPGALAGAIAGTRLAGEAFELVVAAVMIVMLALMVTGSDRPASAVGRPVSRRRNLAGHAAMVGVGFWGGFLQIGVGFLIMPILHRIMGMDLVRTNMQKVFVMLLYTALALVVFAAHGQVNWWVGVVLALGNSTGGWLGARTSLARGDRVIRLVLYVTLTIFVVRLLVF